MFILLGILRHYHALFLRCMKKKMANRFDEVRDRSMGLAKPFTFEACADTYATAIADF